MAAAGPFTTSDNLDMEPLRDLLSVVERSRPDVLILVSCLLFMEWLVWLASPIPWEMYGGTGLPDYRIAASKGTLMGALTGFLSFMKPYHQTERCLFNRRVSQSAYVGSSEALYQSVKQ